MQTTFVCDLKSDLNWVFEIMHCMNNALRPFTLHRQTPTNTNKQVGSSWLLDLEFYKK